MVDYALIDLSNVDPATGRAALGAAPDTFAIALTDAQDRTLEQRFLDHICVLDFIPQSLHAAIRAGTSTADLTTYIRAALATGRSIFFPAGRYKITNICTIQSGQSILGEGVAKSIIAIDSSFSLSATAVFVAATGDSSGWDGVQIKFDQAAATNRATCTQYPWALDIRNATRFKGGCIRVSGAWNGIRADGNCGGSRFALIELGAINEGLLLDGPRDFIHFDTLHIYPFGFTTPSSLLDSYSDGNTIGAEFGRVDGLAIKTLVSFAAKVITNANGNAVVARMISAFQLDGNGSDLELSSGNWQIGLLSSTKNTNSATPPVLFSGATVNVGIFRLSGATNGAPYAKVTGGVVNLVGGSIEQASAVQPAVEVTGGVCMLRNSNLVPANNTRYAPFIRADGGVLVAKDNTNTQGAGAGPLIQVVQDLAGNDISGNDFRGYTYSVPSSMANGTYGPNIVPGISFTPSFTFVTPGDFSSTYVIRQGRMYPEAAGYRFDIRLNFSTNAYTSAAGTAKITGLPVARGSGAIDSMQYPVVPGNVTLSSGYTALSAVVPNGSTELFMRQSGSAKAIGGVGPSSFPASGSGYELYVSGFVPTR